MAKQIADLSALRTRRPMLFCCAILRALPFQSCAASHFPTPPGCISCLRQMTHTLVGNVIGRASLRETQPAVSSVSCLCLLSVYGWLPACGFPAGAPPDWVRGAFDSRVWTLQEAGWHGNSDVTATNTRQDMM
jgi:hypothetical protein